MTNLLPFFVLAELDAAQFRDATAGRLERIEPRKIDEGTYAGKWAIPARVKDDPAHSDLTAAFAVMTEIPLDADVCWPPSPEELARRKALEE
jgi:hypothetical protein